MNDKPILLIEDNPDDVELTLEALSGNKITNNITVARDGEEAAAFLFEKSEAEALPMLILLDLKLPKINGIELLKMIRDNPATKFLPVVILTSSDEERDLLDCYESGCNSYIKKPVDFHAFVDAIKNLGLYWLILNEMPPISK